MAPPARLLLPLRASPFPPNFPLPSRLSPSTLCTQACGRQLQSFERCEAARLRLRLDRAALDQLVKAPSKEASQSKLLGQIHPASVWRLPNPAVNFCALLQAHIANNGAPQES